MAKYGLLIDLDRCVGCRTHEIVCKKEGNEVVRQPLITISRTTDEGKKVMQYLPFVQAECSKSKLCVQRVDLLHSAWTKGRYCITFLPSSVECSKSKLCVQRV